MVLAKPCLFSENSDMTDRISQAHRRWIMSRVRSRNTKPEIMVRMLLHRMGYRFTVRGPRNRALPGRPDIVLPKYRAAVFVHGCFWHRHAGCPSATMPSTRSDYWRKKFETNVARDQRNRRELMRLGWRVRAVWECDVYRHPDRVGRRLDAWLNPRRPFRYEPLPDRKSLYKLAEARADYTKLSRPAPSG